MLLALSLACHPCTNPPGTYSGEAAGDFASQVTVHLLEREEGGDEQLFGVGLLTLDVPEPYFENLSEAPAEFTFWWPCEAAGGIAEPGEEDGAFRYDISGEFDREEWLEGTLQIEFVGTVIAGSWEARHHVDGEEDLPVYSGDILAVRE